MSERAIDAAGLGKQYRLGIGGEPYGLLRDALARLARRRGPLVRRPADTIWALRDLSLRVDQGEVVGIIGANGSGKSTLLKILSRITPPTTGQVDLYGRVSSLLEVGTGFHPELTGRENVFLNGAILGMRRAEIASHFDEIAAFADVDRFIDTPVKRYSSGMYLRLAFAIAAHLEPEILLVDEVLAVGDAAFQAKCLSKMGVVARRGRTILFVSHHMPAILGLCGRAIWLDRGRVAREGDARDVVAAYLNHGRSLVTERRWPLEQAPASREVRLVAASLRPAGDEDEISVATPFDAEIEFWNRRPGARLSLTLRFLDEQGTLIFQTYPIRDTEWLRRQCPAGLIRSTCRVPAGLLNDGLHRIDLLVVEDEATPVLSVPDVLVFPVHDSAQCRANWFGKWPGLVRPQLEWQTTFVGEVAGEKWGG